jgi:DNA-binding LytR/AlgR family response regulator
MQVLVIEDETLAQERIVNMLMAYDKSIDVLACLQSVEETVEWLNKQRQPDLLIMDIHLSDGYSFEILKQVKINIPIIFTTAYDQYAIESFKHHSIDYILKPVTQEALAAALNKFKTIHNYNTNYLLLTSQLQQMQQQANKPLKSRFLIKTGQKLSFIPTEEVAMFWVDNKNTYLTDCNGNKFLLNHSLEAVEKQIDQTQFFRINRKQIVNINAISQIKNYINNRLVLQLKNITSSVEIMVSRERVTDFKNWIDA